MTNSPSPSKKNREGIALFMVMSAVAVLSILVTELVFVTQVNHKMVYNSLNQLKAQYTAEAGFKFSLARLKLFWLVKSAASNPNGPVGQIVGKKTQLLDMIWQFPAPMFPYFEFPPPIQDEMSLTAKDSLSKFIKESSIEGVFRTTIEAEATKLNLNSVLDAFYKPVPQPSPSPGASPTPTPTASPTPAPTAADAEKLIVDTFTNIFNEKVKTDEDFAAEYRGFDLDEFRDTLLTYLNNKHVPRLGKWDEIPPKKAPMYSIKELRLLPTMDDTLYELFAPNFTVFPTGTLNVNKLKKQEFLSLFATANIKEEEVDDLLTFRDSPPDVDYPTRGPFPGIKEFIIYLTNNISYFGKDQNKVENYIKSTFEPAGIVLSVSTDVFKITSTGIVGPDQASLDANVTRKIEAWVTLLTPPTPPPTGINPNQPQAPPTPNTGLKINFMRIY